MDIQLSPSGNFILAVPSDGPKASGVHHVVIPATLTGIAVLKKILSKQSRKRDAIGSESAPTQHMIDQWLKADAEAKAVATAKRFEELGLDISSLKIEL
jgi:hypothetical protein